MASYYQATIVINSPMRQQFSEVMEEFIPLMGGFGFKMMHAFSTVTDRVGTFIHLWEIEDANMLVDGIQKWREHEDFPRISKKLYECIISESIILLRKAPYFQPE
ncbi:hypothetical protein K3M67_05560 [Sphingobium sp. V4]|uniref:hypothetical protein n=1 Tax=Sphingobium sp. V4 TaxID=3038927 RepID=UPI002557CF91|nr:hypothetical protein [Sphingobium sp. V4]WIW89436.1 hypothetical protein K3M67_05560 [Sphingobium sp. V4]